jgi:predicted amidohydrolase YtcJ
LTAADIILENAEVITFDAASPRGEALAVKGDRILRVGTREEVLACRSERTEVIDCAGGCIIPGFNDTHAHMEREGLKQLRPSLAGARSVREVLDRIREAAAGSEPGEWIVTMPVGDPPFFFGAVDNLAEGRMPTRQELDEAAPDNPVYIPGLFGNWGAPPGYSVLNSAGLRLNGITRESSPRCEGVEIRLDAETGEPTGVIVEHNPRPTIEFDLLPAVPRFGFADRLEGVRRSMRLYNARGTTSIYEGHGSAPETISVYRRLWEEGGLTVRVGLVVSPCWSDLREARLAMRDWLAYARGAGLGDPWLRVSGVHIAYGGSATVAACARACLPDTGWSGFVEQAYTKDEFREACFMAAEHDLRLHTIVGDQLHEIVPVLEAIDERYPLAGKRWVIEHVARVREDDLHALKRLGVIVTTIPVYYLWKGGRAYLAEPDGGESVVPHRLIMELGIPLAIATDNIPYDPFFTLQTAIERRERSTGKVIGPDQALDLITALRLFTVAGAQLTFDEDWKGPLRSGFAADLALLDRNPATSPLSELTKTQCKLTLVGGARVFSS